MTLIDGDKIVTAQLYDDQYEEFTEEKMSIIDYINAYTDEGVTTADDVLNKIREEIEHLTYYWCEVNPKSVIDDALQIIDKYRNEVSVGEAVENGTPLDDLRAEIEKISIAPFATAYTANKEALYIINKHIGEW